MQMYILYRQVACADIRLDLRVGSLSNLRDAAGLFCDGGNVCDISIKICVSNQNIERLVDI